MCIWRPLFWVFCPRNQSPSQLYGLSRLSIVSCPLLSVSARPAHFFRIPIFFAKRFVCPAFSSLFTWGAPQTSCLHRQKDNCQAVRQASIPVILTMIPVLHTVDAISFPLDTHPTSELLRIFCTPSFSSTGKYPFLFFTYFENL